MAASLRDAKASLGETRPRETLAIAAAKAEKQAGLLQAEAALAQAEFERSRAAEAQKAAAGGPPVQDYYLYRQRGPFFGFSINLNIALSGTG